MRRYRDGMKCHRHDCVMLEDAEGYAYCRVCNQEVKGCIGIAIVFTMTLIAVFVAVWIVWLSIR